MPNNIKETPKISIICSIEIIRCQKPDGWGVASVSVDKVEKGYLELNRFKDITITGVMPQLSIGSQYKLTAELCENPKYGKQYKVISMANNITFDVNDKVGQKKFLSSLYTPLQIDELYNTLEDPYKVLTDSNAAELVKVKGCGMDTAVRWINKFHNHIDVAKIYTELEDYNLTNNMITRLMEVYKSPEIVIEKVKNNPYILCEDVDGIGWKTADSIALDGGIEEFSEIRVKAFILHYLNASGLNGNSWISPDQLLGAVIETLGEEVPDTVITKSLTELISDNKVYTNDDKTQIALMKFHNIEVKLAEELIRLRDSSNDFNYGNWEDEINHVEQNQGWKFSEEQMKGIKLLVDNNIVVISGYAGTGKSSLVAGILAVLKNYSYAQTALSGRAASRMSEITHKEGFTIHRLLGYPSTDENNKNGFAFHDENQLPYDIIIIDEISMIDTYLFYDLLRSIKSGSKVIMLGDHGQLQSIGSGNVAYDMLMANEIPSIILSTIHRQASDSGIISESINVRKGIQIIDKDQCGITVKGKLQDLIIDSYIDSSNTYYKTIQYFSKEIQNGTNIMDIQMLSATRTKGDASVYNLNNIAQEIYNPNQNKKKREVTVMYDGKPSIIREGDKIINNKNNYKTRPCIYNGNIGIVRSIYDGENDEGDMIQFMSIDFDSIGTVEVPQPSFNAISLGYAITVHKFQGSECDNLIFALDSNSYSLLSRELLYTGITRAKKKCTLVAQASALRLATGRESGATKQTFLQDCIYDITHPKLVF